MVLFLVGNVLCASMFMSTCGCEKDADTKNVDEYFDENEYESADRQDPIVTITISPATASLATDGEYEVFKAGGGAAPYTWSVQDVSRGSILQHSTASAVYQRDASGDNVVIAEDSHGIKGFASISQP